MRKKVISKEQVIEEASKIVSEQGLESCSMRALANSLGVAVGTIYNYFPSQDELFQVLFVTSWQKTIEILKESVAAQTGYENKFRTYCNVLMDEIAKRKGLGFFVFGKLGVGRVIAQSENGLGEGLIEPLKVIIMESDRNKHLDDEGLGMTVEWLLFTFNSYYVFERSNREKFIDLLVERFV